ncbi:MAG: hypothetical protein Q9205_002283 [Flavoplaca limonia]
MSYASPFDPPATDAEIDIALREAVVKRFQSNPEQLTIKKIRTDVERQLGLGDGFFKADMKWNPRSKETIQLQVDAQEAQSQPSSSQPHDPSPPKQQKQSETKAKAERGRKRSSKPGDAPRKRQKKSNRSEGYPEKISTTSMDVLGDSANSSPLSAGEEKERTTIADSNPIKSIPNGAEDQRSESEMSVLLDEDPKPKKRGRKVSPGKPKSKTDDAKNEGSKSVKTQQQNLDPDTEEIKRLQGWLVKCGIRKMWFKELARYDTSRAKIRHLKEMLAEAGMVGRFSQEKATQIREERELKADLDAVQAGNKQWGKVDSDGGSESRPSKRLARGLQELDFLRDDDSDDD